MKEPIRIDFKKGILKTPEHTYYVRGDLSMSHWIEFEQLQAQAAYGLTFSDFYNQDTQIVKLFNEHRGAEAITVVVNRLQLIDSIKTEFNSQGMKLDKRRHALLRIACLFLVEKEEDMTKFNEELFNQKVDDILESGVNKDDLFSLAVRLVPGFVAACQNLSRTIFQIPQMVESKKKRNIPIKE